MRVLALALGGCVRGDPSYGITEDTGGHITYLLGAMRALADRPDIIEAEIATRRFCDAKLGAVHAKPVETLGPKLRITRIATANVAYLAKEQLAQDIPAFTQALIAELRGRDTKPDIIHAHFADAARVAREVRRVLGIPFIYTAHSLGIDKAQAMTTASIADAAIIAARIAEETAAITSADAIIGSSRDECERQLMAYAGANETRIHRVRPGIDQTPASVGDIAAGRELLAPFLRYPDRPVVLAIARAVEKKNLLGLINAFGASDSLREQANLVVVPGRRDSMATGEPGQAAVLTALFDALDRHDLHGIVAYPRQHSQAAVRGLYALARETGGVFVNPAFIEPFGLTILEAAVHGVPVVATCRGGPADIVDEIGHGALVDPEDTAAIGAAITDFLDDPARWKRASENALKNVRNVQWSRYAAGFTDIARCIVQPPATNAHAASRRRLLICDIDNTLTGSRDAARRFSDMLAGQSDLAFGVATGRSLVEARRLMREWQLPVPQIWITSVGSEIYWPEQTSSRAESLRLDVGFARHIDLGWDAARVRAVLRHVPGLTEQSGVDQRNYKCSYFASSVSAASAVEHRLAAAGVRARVVFSHDRLLDILPVRAGKGAALAHVANRLNIAADRTFAAGDSGNDIDLLQSCPNAIAVANCEPAVRRMAMAGGAYLARAAYADGVVEGMNALRDTMNKAPGESAAA